MKDERLISTEQDSELDISKHAEMEVEVQTDETLDLPHISQGKKVVHN